MTAKNPFSNSDDVEVVSRTTQHDSFLKVECLQLRHRLFEGGWSDTISRELVVRTPAVGVLLHDPHQSEFVMVRQFRVGMLDAEESAWPLELVAGLADGKGSKDGEDGAGGQDGAGGHDGAGGQDESDGQETLEAVARREVREETGLVADQFTKICDYYSSPGASSELVSLFMAKVDASAAGGVHGLDQEHEDIRVERISEQEARQALQSGAINNAMTFIALQWFFLNHPSSPHHQSP